MARDSRLVPPTKLTGKWLDQDVNNVSEFEEHGVRLPHDYTEWSSLSGEVITRKMSKEELDEYKARVKK